MKELVEAIAEARVDSPDEVFVAETTEDDGTIILELHVAKDDMGKVTTFNLDLVRNEQVIIDKMF